MSPPTRNASKVDLQMTNDTRESKTKEAAAADAPQASTAEKPSPPHRKTSHLLNAQLEDPDNEPASAGASERKKGYMNTDDEASEGEESSEEDEVEAVRRWKIPKCDLQYARRRHKPDAENGDSPSRKDSQSAAGSRSRIFKVVDSRALSRANRRLVLEDVIGSGSKSNNAILFCINGLALRIRR